MHRGTPGNCYGRTQIVTDVNSFIQEVSTKFVIVNHLTVFKFIEVQIQHVTAPLDKSPWTQ